MDVGVSHVRVPIRMVLQWWEEMRLSMILGDVNA